MADESQTPAEETEVNVTPSEGEGPEVIISGEVEEPTPGLVEVEVEAEEYVPERVPREKPAVPGADLEVDIVPEGVDPLAGANIDPYAEYDQDDAAAVEGKARLRVERRRVARERVLGLLREHPEPAQRAPQDLGQVLPRRRHQRGAHVAVALG